MDEAGSARRGPFVRAAFFCDSVIREAGSGRTTFVGCFDRAIVTDSATSQENAASDDRAATLSALLVVELVAENGPSEAEVRLRLETPDGEVRDVGESALLDLSGRFASARGEIRAELTLSQGGLHWVHILVGGQPATQVPFEVRTESSP